MATYPIAPGDVFEFQMVGRLHGQTTRNTFWYQYVGANPIADGVAEITEWLDSFKTAVTDFFIAVQSEEFLHVHNRAQRIGPTRMRAVFDEINAPASVAEGSLPSGVAVVLRRQGMGAGRRYQGRVYVPGIPIGSEDDSRLDAAVLADWEVVASTLADILIGTDPDHQLQPIISSVGGVTTFDEVSVTALDINLRYQRRREVGVGE